MRYRSSATTCARFAVAVALFVFALAAPAPAAEKALWGPITLPNGSSAFELYDELGIDTLQVTVTWAGVAPVRPADATDPGDPSYRFSADLDFAAREAR